MFGQIETAPAPMTAHPFAPWAVSECSPEIHGNAGTQDWQAKAIAEYSASAQACVRECLARRILALTGYAPRAEAITVDAAGYSAMTTVHDVTFRLRERELMIVRPCAHCQTGRFESLPITSLSDLGYVLAAWHPYHCECEPADPNDDVSW